MIPLYSFSIHRPTASVWRFIAIYLSSAVNMNNNSITYTLKPCISKTTKQNMQLSGQTRKADCLGKISILRKYKISSGDLPQYFTFQLLSLYSRIPSSFFPTFLPHNFSNQILYFILIVFIFPFVF